MRDERTLLLLLFVTLVSAPIKIFAEGCAYQLVSSAKQQKKTYFVPLPIKVETQRILIDYEGFSTGWELRAKQAMNSSFIPVYFDRYLRIEKFYYENFVIEVSTVELVPHRADHRAQEFSTFPNLPNDFSEEIKFYFSRIASSLDFAFTQYEKRKKTWPEKFYKNLLGAAFKYSFLSTFGDVKEYSSKTNTIGSELGSLKIVNAPFFVTNGEPTKLSGLNPDEQYTLKEKWIEIHQRTSPIPHIKKPILITSDWKSNFLKTFAPHGITFHPSTIGSLMTHFGNQSIYQTTPLEDLTDVHPDTINRTAVGTDGMIDEVGNLAVLPKFKNEGMRQLLFHGARVLNRRNFEFTDSRSVTFAEQGSSSDRYYKTLSFQPFGFPVAVPSFESSKSDFSESKDWDLLDSPANGVLNALVIRFGLNGEQLRKVYEDFKTFDSLAASK